MLKIVHPMISQMFVLEITHLSEYSYVCVNIVTVNPALTMQGRPGTHNAMLIDQVPIMQC